MHAQIMEQPCQLEIWLRLNPPTTGKKYIIATANGSLDCKLKDAAQGPEKR